MNILQKVKNHWPFFVFLLVFIVLIGSKLIFQMRPFYDWDESLYIENGREMVNQHYLLFPLWQGQPWLDKPPLIPLLYGIVINVFSFSPPEISARLFSLSIACVVLTFLYGIYFRVTNKKFIALLSVIMTAFTPLFLQRTQTVNLDIFVLLSWVGYLYFYKDFKKSLLFLFIGIMSKSLIGFYPVGVLGIYILYARFFSKRMSQKEFMKLLKQMTIQVSIMALWYIAMLAVFKDAFFREHIIESHFKRVSSSIESHFGEKTYYINVMIEQIGLPMFILSIMGAFVMLYQYIKKQLPEEKALYGMFLMPWFVFLNLTKTKIFWYLLPAIPQFAFLPFYPLTLVSKKKFIYFGAGIFILGIFLYRNLYQQRFLSAQYSDYSPHYELAIYARSECNEIDALMNPTTRNTYDTLHKMNLTITTTDWWGEHPSMVFYFDKKINMIYSKNEMSKRLASLDTETCVITVKEDEDILKSNLKLKLLKKFGEYSLFKIQ